MDSIRKYFDEKTLLGPEAPQIARINNLYYYKAMIKIKPDQSVNKIKLLLEEALNNLHQIKVFRSVKIDFDVDPI